MSKALIKAGRAVLETPPGRSVLRIWYVSEGGETLYTDTAPLTEQEADALEATLRHKSTASYVVRYSPYASRNPYGARGVVFPSERGPA